MVQCATFSFVVFYLITVPLAVSAQQTLLPQLDDPAARHIQDTAAGVQLFKEQVQPLLAQHCLVCHGGAQQLGGFDLSNREALIASGNLGENAASSLLVK